MDEAQKKYQEHLVKLKQLQESLNKIEVEVLTDGKLPVKAHATDAGFDVFATSDIEVWPGQVVKHPLNIRIKFPQGAWGRIETKSGLGARGHMVWAGVIDESYRGIPHVIMTNVNWNAKPFIDEDGKPNLAFEPTPLVIKKGEKVAQLTMNPHSNGFFIEQVETVDTNTDRGTGGFGSSGK